MMAKRKRRALWYGWIAEGIEPRPVAVWKEWLTGSPVHRYRVSDRIDFDGPGRPFAYVVTADRVFRERSAAYRSLAIRCEEKARTALETAQMYHLLADSEDDTEEAE